MDHADRAQELQQIEIDTAVRRRRPEPGDVRECLNCEEPLPPGNRFCDPDCRYDHARRQAKLENERVLEGLR